MDKRLFGALMYVSGMAVGIACGFLIGKSYIQEKADEEMAAVRAFYHKKFDSKDDEEFLTVKIPVGEIEETIPSNESKLDPEFLAIAASYISDVLEDDSGFIDDEEEDYPEYEPDIPEETVEQPYQITEEEFGEFDDYECVTLNYFLDQVLTDEYFDPIEDPKRYVGDVESMPDYFGEFEDDCVYVRNDELRCDYEVIFILDTYAHRIQKHPIESELYQANKEG